MWLLLFLIFIFFFLLRPAWRVFRAVRHVRQQSRQFQDLFNQASGHQPPHPRPRRGDDRGGRKGGWSRPGAPRRKKIDPAVGEFVRFREVEVQTAQQSTASRGEAASFAAESQVTDVEWEDLPRP